MPSTAKTHYDLLNLSRKSELTLAEVKQGYHQTLLTYHPDKIKQDSTSSRGSISKPATANASVPSIDEIVCAYNVLSDPMKRAAYDATLKAQVTNLAQLNLDASGHAGLESYDLEELDYEEEQDTARGTWSRGCRCGNEQGYIVTEEELEHSNQADQQDGFGGTGEVLVGCQGCSLLVRVTYAVEAG